MLAGNIQFEFFLQARKQVSGSGVAVRNTYITHPIITENFEREGNNNAADI